MTPARKGLPVTLYVTGKRCVVVDQGEAAGGRVRTLGKLDACVQRLSVHDATTDALTDAFRAASKTSKKAQSTSRPPQFGRGMMGRRRREVERELLVASHM